jgi:hypothetical protein
MKAQINNTEKSAELRALRYLCRPSSPPDHVPPKVKFPLPSSYEIVSRVHSKTEPPPIYDLPGEEFRPLTK